MDFLRELLRFFRDEANRDAVAAITTVITVFAGGGAWLWSQRKKTHAKTAASKSPPEIKYEFSESAQGGFAEAPGGIASGQVLGNQTIQHGAPLGHVTLSLDDYEARQKKLRAAVETELEGKFGEERAQLQARLGEVNRRLDDPEGALKEARTRISELEALLGNAESEEEQAAHAALDKGDFETARELFERLQARTSLDVVKNAKVHYALGQIAEEEVRWADAAEHYTRAADLLPSYDHLNKAQLYARLSGNLPVALRYGTALLQFARAESNETDLATALNNHALNLQSAGRYDEAEPLSRDALNIRRTTLGEENPGYAQSLNNLAFLLRAKGRYDEAEPLYREALDIRRTTLGEAHPDYAQSLNNLAELLRVTERFAEAEQLFRAALEIGSETLGEAHPEYATYLNNLALLLEAAGRYDEAEPLFRRALDIRRTALREAHPDYAGSLNNLAVLLEAMGRYDEAEPLYREALKVVESALGPDHPSTKTVRGNLEAFLAERAKDAP